MYPGNASIGRTIPTRDVRTKGRRQYPNTDAERGKVRFEELAGAEDDEEDEAWECACEGWSG